MSDENKTTHIPPIGGNTFAGQGFPPEQAARLLAESGKRISEELTKIERGVTHHCKFKLDELLAECDRNAPLLQIDERDELVPMGREILDR